MSTISRLHSITHFGMDDSAAHRTVVVLRNRCANLRYAILAESYLFGIVLFMAFQFVARFIMGNDLEGQLTGTFVSAVLPQQNVVSGSAKIAQR